MLKPRSGIARERTKLLFFKISSFKSLCPLGNSFFFRPQKKLRIKIELVSIPFGTQKQNQQQQQAIYKDGYKDMVY